MTQQLPLLATQMAAEQKPKRDFLALDRWNADPQPHPNSSCILHPPKRFQPRRLSVFAQQLSKAGFVGRSTQLLYLAPGRVCSVPTKSVTRLAEGFLLHKIQHSPCPGGHMPITWLLVIPKGQGQKCPSGLSPLGASGASAASPGRGRCETPCCEATLSAAPESQWRERHRGKVRQASLDIIFFVIRSIALLCSKESFPYLVPELIKAEGVCWEMQESKVRTRALEGG